MPSPGTERFFQDGVQYGDPSAGFHIDNIAKTCRNSLALGIAYRQESRFAPLSDAKSGSGRSSERTVAGR